MPTQRRRIGFLPRSDVHNIIDKICNHNKLSQSKVTGILVEEALKTRGVLNSPITKLSFDFSSNNGDEFLTASKKLSCEFPYGEDDFNLDDEALKHEVQMINDFIEFKFFKKIMTRNKGERK